MKYIKVIALVTINCTHHKTSEVLVIFHLVHCLQTKGILSSKLSLERYNSLCCGSPFGISLCSEKFNKTLLIIISIICHDWSSKF